MSDNSCGSYPAAKQFVFGTPAIQAAAGTVYESKQAAIALGVKRFKTDAERMQYLLGQRARSATCCNAGTRCSQTG